MRWISLFLVLSMVSLTGLEAQPEPRLRSGVEGFVAAVKSGSPDRISEWIAYPLLRPEPLPSIENRAAFLQRFYQVFDPEFLESLANSSIDGDWSTVGWRGTCYKDGLLWLDEDGKLSALHVTSRAEKAEIGARLAMVKKQLHPSVARFKNPISEFQTSSFHVRIDELENGKLRYAAWKRPSGVETAPSLILDNGVYRPEGSGGNHSYLFDNKGYQYVVSFIVMGTDEDPPVVLSVYQGDRLLSEQPGEIIQP
jgi:hypothetical protein